HTSTSRMLVFLSYLFPVLLPLCSFPPRRSSDLPAYGTFRHFAMQVGSVADVDAWAAWLRSNDVDVLGPVDHGIIYSVYFHDPDGDRKSTRLNSSHVKISYAVFCLKKKQAHYSDS